MDFDCLRLVRPVMILSVPKHWVRTCIRVYFTQLDGGGIRGLSSLLILKEIFARIQQQEGLEELPLPWKYFDMIAGTSTGGYVVL